MATSSITIPAHLYAHTEVNINDNSIRSYSRSYEGNCKVLAVFMSPKGEDGVITRVDTGKDEFVEKFGLGPMSIYGQPLVNAYASASTGVVSLQCLRITAPNATYANKHIFIQWKIAEEANPDHTGEEDDTTPETIKKMYVRFKAVSDNNLTNLDDLVDNVTAPTLSEEDKTAGWKSERFISVACVGRGLWGNNIHFRIANHPRADKGNTYKNYAVSVFESTTMKETYKATINEDAIINGNSLFMDAVINDEIHGKSNYVVVNTNPTIINTLFEAYKANVDPDTELTEYTFDPLLGINKNLASAKSQSWDDFSKVAGAGIVNFVIDESTELQLNTTLGFALDSGDDGDFKYDPANLEKRRIAIDNRYADAFEGKIDRNILSKAICPLDVVFDANFPIGDDKPNGEGVIEHRNVKRALANFITTRHEDCFCFMDLNTDFATKEEAYTYSEDLDLDVNWWTFSIDAYYGKIKDPYSKKIVTVTSTYNLAINYPIHFANYGGKHIPYAGSKYGIIDRFIPNTVFPVYDEDLDYEHLDKLVDMHVNYAQVDVKGNIIRGSQTTRYPYIGDSLTMSNLTETNNALIILDIKKDATKMVLDYMYNFNEASDLALFNRDAEQLCAKYADAQVKSISAYFERTDEEAELGILHLYIAVVHKALVKINMIDIDVNRSVES